MPNFGRVRGFNNVFLAKNSSRNIEMADATVLSRRQTKNSKILFWQQVLQTRRCCQTKTLNLPSAKFAEFLRLGENCNKTFMYDESCTKSFDVAK
jgi:hypothetical protein